MMMSPGFPTLAVEVIELIATFAEPIDLRSLRLACRELNRKILISFGRANFATIQTDLSRKNLERLESISSAKHLATHLQFLHIKADSEDIIGKDFHWPRLSSGCLADNPNGADELREVLSQGLYNCRSFVIHTWDEYEPGHDTDRLMPSDAVGLFLSIVAAAGIQLQSFTIQKCENGTGRLDTPRLQMPLSQTTKFVQAWSQLEALVLDYSITSNQYGWVLHLISLVPRLRKLSLECYEGSTWITQRLSFLPDLHRLEELRLRSALVTVEALTSLLVRNRDTLNSLSLRFTTLDDGGEWSTVFARLKFQFAQLQNLELYFLRQGNIHDRIVFPKLSKYPVIPGSELYRNDRRQYDSRRIESVEDPIGLRYYGTNKRIVGVEYHGKEIDPVLSALADSVELWC